MKLLAFFFCIGVLSLLLITANAIFGLGIWQPHEYPAPFNFQSTPDGGTEQVPSDYGTCLWQLGLLTAGIGGLWLLIAWWRVRDV